MALLQINPLLFSVLPFAIAAFIGGAFLAERAWKWRWVGLAYAAAALLAVPGILFSLYYLHWFDRAQWFYEFRTLPYSELSAVGLGLFAGMLPALFGRRRVIFLGTQTAAVVLLAAWLSTPYLKMLFGPLELSALKYDADRGSICQQSSGSTCGPASAATLVWRMGKFVTEKELARESFTTQSGTECWYLARALQRRGFDVDYVFLPEAPPQLLARSIAGVRMGGPHGPGHFVTVLADYDGTYVIGDPMPGVGKVYIDKRKLNEGEYYFTGFFMLVREKTLPASSRRPSEG